jgi:hypothetical protein
MTTTAVYNVFLPTWANVLAPRPGVLAWLLVMRDGDRGAPAPFHFQFIPNPRPS